MSNSSLLRLQSYYFLFQPTPAAIWLLSEIWEATPTLLNAAPLPLTLLPPRPHPPETLWRIFVGSELSENVVYTWGVFNLLILCRNHCPDADHWTASSLEGSVFNLSVLQVPGQFKTELWWRWLSMSVHYILCEKGDSLLRMRSACANCCSPSSLPPARLSQDCCWLHILSSAYFANSNILH